MILSVVTRCLLGACFVWGLCKTPEFYEMSRKKDSFSSIRKKHFKSTPFPKHSQPDSNKEKLKEKNHLVSTDRGNNMDGVNNLPCPHPIGSGKRHATIIKIQYIIQSFHFLFYQSAQVAFKCGSPSSCAH